MDLKVDQVVTAAGPAVSPQKLSPPQSRKKQSPPPPPPPPPPASQQQKPRRRRIRSELDRLLSDEGTRNMLKAIKKSNQKPSNAIFRTRVVAEQNKKGKKVVVNNNNNGSAAEPRKRNKGNLIRGVVIRKARERSNTNTTTNNNNNAYNNNNAGRKDSNGVIRKIDYSVVTVTRRGTVGFITIACSEPECAKEDKERSAFASSTGDDTGGGGGGGAPGGATSTHAGSAPKGGSKGGVINGAFSLKVLQSVDSCVRNFEQDNSISIIVLQNSHSKYFCNGLDLHELVAAGSSASGSGRHAGGNTPSSSSPFSTIIKAVKSLISTLSSTRKLTIASVSGDCVGFGVMILPLFDLVFASDKSMFRVHYNALGQSPEGIGLLQNLLCGSGAGKIASLLYLNIPLTACEAQSAGLVTETLWPARYQEELAARLQALSSTASVVNKTKVQMKTYKRAFKLVDLSNEFNGIEAQWGSDLFRENAKALIGSEDGRGHHHHKPTTTPHNTTCAAAVDHSRTPPSQFSPHRNHHHNNINNLVVNGGGNSVSPREPAS